jgi:hypothetical protein
MRTVLKTYHALWHSLLKTRSHLDLLDTRKCVCNVLTDCGSEYVGETGRQMVVHLKEQQCFRQGLMEESKLSQHAYEEGHQVNLRAAKVLHTESNCTWKKYKGSDHMQCTANLINQPSLE